MVNIILCSSSTQLHMNSVFLLLMQMQKHSNLSLPPIFYCCDSQVSLLIIFLLPVPFIPISTATRIAPPCVWNTHLFNIPNSRGFLSKYYSTFLKHCFDYVVLQFRSFNSSPFPTVIVPCL